MSIPITPVRCEPLFLDRLRTLFPDVRFGTVKSRETVSYEECVLADSMQGMRTPVTQYVRLRLSVYSVRADGTSDWDKAVRLYARIENEIIKLGKTRPLVDASHESGPVRMADDDIETVHAYGVILLEVVVA